MFYNVQVQDGWFKQLEVQIGGKDQGAPLHRAQSRTLSNGNGKKGLITFLKRVNYNLKKG